MKRWLLAGLVALTLPGCSTLAGLGGNPSRSDQAEILRALGDHVDHCDRHYQGSLGLGGGFTFNIDCKAREAGSQP